MFHKQVYQAVQKYVEGSTFIVSQQQQPGKQVFPDTTFCKYVATGGAVVFRDLEETLEQPAWMTSARHDGNK